MKSSVKFFIMSGAIFSVYFDGEGNAKSTNATDGKFTISGEEITINDNHTYVLCDSCMDAFLLIKDENCLYFVDDNGVVHSVNKKTGNTTFSVVMPEFEAKFNPYKTYEEIVFLPSDGMEHEEEGGFCLWNGEDLMAELDLPR